MTAEPGFSATGLKFCNRVIMGIERARMTALDISSKQLCGNDSVIIENVATE